MKFLSILITTIIFGAVLFNVVITKNLIPDAYLPWEAIRIDDDINFLTKTKIYKLKHDYEACKTFFKNSDIEYKLVRNRRAQQCILTDQIQIDKSLYPYSAYMNGQCGLMAAVTIWEKQVLEPLSFKYLSSPIEEIIHYGIFVCRSVRGASSRRSQHATANAIDIAGFKLRDGQEISILEDWHKDTNEGLFLRAVFERSCSIFNGSLGPNYNEAHKNHFHFDLGPFNVCH